MTSSLQVIATCEEDAHNAYAGGASNLEVTVDLAVGGLTPPLALVERLRETLPIPLHVMLRPHARDFVYTPDEIDLMLRQTQQFKILGAQGIVFGALTAEGVVDVALVRRVAQVAQPMCVTLHRALDGCVNPDAALDALDGYVQRVLTSGGAATAWDGRETIRRWIAQYGRLYTFVVGAGVHLNNIAALVRDIGAPEYHVGSGARTGQTVDQDKVRQFVQYLA